MSVKIQAIPMSNGDAFIVEYIGISGNRHVIVLDMGTQSAYVRCMKQVLKKYGEVDLCVLSHNHEDHIGGALKYVHDAYAGESLPYVREWWFNAKRVSSKHKVITDAPQISPKQANEIAEYLSSEYNEGGWNNTIKSGLCFDYDGLIIRVLSPRTIQPCTGQPYAEDGRVEIPISVGPSDYDVPIDKFNTSNFQEDNKEEHVSCIALLLEFGSKRFLWMADSLPSVVCESLYGMGYSEELSLECEYMTLSHHGSKGNTSKELLSMIDCQKFIVTGNGMNPYHLPSKETLARVIQHKGEDVQFYTTKMSPPIFRIFEIDHKYKIEEKTEFEI